MENHKIINKINEFLNKIVSFGPIWAPTRTGPQPGLGPNPARVIFVYVFFFDFSGPLGPIKAHMGPCGPGLGP